MVCLIMLIHLKKTYSYTHNWPHDPYNEQTLAISVLVLFIGLMVTLYLWDQLSYEDDDITHKGQPLTRQCLESGIVTPTQQCCCNIRSAIHYMHVYCSKEDGTNNVTDEIAYIGLNTSASPVVIIFQCVLI
eukprot:15154_1